MLRSAILLVLLSCMLSQAGLSQTESQLSDTTFTTVKLPMFDLGFGWSVLMSDVGNASPAPSIGLQLSYGISIRQPVLPYLNVSLDFATGKFFGEKALGDTGNINYQTSVITQGLRVTYEASHLFDKNEKGYVPYQPYIGVGVGLISFRGKGDLKNASGERYHYWNDGTIRNMEETAANQDQATEIERDFTYESDLRDANLDGFGRYDQMALRVPIELGFRYQFTKRIGAHIKGVYHLNFTDLIDNISDQSIGDRAGSTGNDNHISAMLGVSVFLGEHKKPKRKKKIKEPKENLIASAEDSVSDQSAESIEEIVTDTTENKQSETAESTDNTALNEKIHEGELPSGSKENVEQSGEDTSTNDSLTDSGNSQDSSEYNEESDEIELTDSTSESEPETGDGNSAKKDTDQTSNEASGNDVQSNASPEANSNNDQETNNGDATDPSSVSTETSNSSKSTESSDQPESAKTSEPTENESVSDGSSTQKDVEMSAIELIDKTMGIESTEPKLAGTYHWADVNKDKYISADEVLHFIDLLFDGESKYTVPMIHNLIEYYFDQD